MEIDTILKRELMFVIVLIAIFWLSLSLQGLAIEEGISQDYVLFYQGLVTTGIIGLTAGISYAFLKTEEFEIFDERWQKILVHGVWIIFIILLTTNAGQVVPVPKAGINSFQLTTETEYYTSAIIPGVLEDFSYNYTFPLLLVILGSIVIHIAGFNVSRIQVIALILGACFITSIGYNIFVIPGFTTAHIPAYGENPQNFIGIFMFSYGQSVVNMITGWFVPFAHIIHNALIVQASQAGLTIGGLEIL